MKTCRIKESAWYAEDGEGAGDVFACFGTACRLMNNAVASKHAVLHVAEILEVE